MKTPFLFFFYLSSAVAAYAQDSLKSSAPWISGYASVYYKYDFNKNVTDNKTSFTNSQNSFVPDMLSVKLQHAIGRISFTGEIGFGKRAEEFSYNDKGLSAAIQQLFITYTPIPWLKLTAGSFATYIGYESAEANMNRNFSMSYLFSYGPFFHTGIKAEATVGASTFLLGIFDPTDYKYAPYHSKKYAGGQWAFSPKGSPFTSCLSYIGGTDTGGVRNDEADLVVTYHFNKLLSMADDIAYSRYGGSVPASCWWGNVWYLNADLSDATGITLRAEYFNDKDNLKVFTDKGKFPHGGSIWSFTLSCNYKIKSLALIPEVRLDHASNPLFTKGGSGIESSPSVLIAAVYSF
ncbi:MAG: porin [Chitinophagaceae bacterium]|nr:MAG: porin [Chitinophagaceae bacterium]